MGNSPYLTVEIGPATDPPWWHRHPIVLRRFTVSRGLATQPSIKDSKAAAWSVLRKVCQVMQERGCTTSMVEETVRGCKVHFPVNLPSNEEAAKLFQHCNIKGARIVGVTTQY